jgi:hypothetical protein
MPLESPAAVIPQEDTTMPTDERARAGGAVAPDITDEELQAAEERAALQERLNAAATSSDPERLPTVDEVLQAGPQPQMDAVEKIKGLKADVEDNRRRPSDMRAKVDQARDQVRAEAAAEMDPAEARSALAIMLSASAPPTDDIGEFEVKRLSQQYGAPFIVTLRGLQPQEFDEITELALREPTRSEKDRGVVGAVQDTPRLQRLTVAQAMLKPDLTDPHLTTKFGPRPEDIVRRWFNSGECVFLSAQITELSGFSGEAVVRAKR